MSLVSFGYKSLCVRAILYSFDYLESDEKKNSDWERRNRTEKKTEKHFKLLNFRLNFFFFTPSHTP